MTETSTLPDTRPLFLQALDQVTPLIADVTPSDLDRPTPCDDWTVRELLGHLVGVGRRIPHIAAGGSSDEVPARTDGVADDGWANSWNDRLGGLRASASGTALDQIVIHPAGRMPWAIALGIYASEMAVHSWDLARALGRDDDLDDSIAAAVVGPMRGALPAEPRVEELGIPFGPVVQVPADAPPYAQLVAWVGRDPEWGAA